MLLAGVSVLALMLPPVFAAGHASSPCAGVATVDDLAACQRRALDAKAQRYAQSHNGELPGEDVLARWQLAQEKERAAFLRKHPDQSGADAQDRGEIAIAPGDREVPTGDVVEPVSDATRPARAKRGDEIDEDNLKKKLLGDDAVSSKAVLSESGARQIGEYLNAKQGGASADMGGLINELRSDGRPSDGTAQRLRQAAGAQGAAADADPSASADEFKKR